LLAELFVFAQEPLSLSQLAQRTGTSMGGVHKEVERLEG
jgi:predicted transcriptional regulator